MSSYQDERHRGKLETNCFIDTYVNNYYIQNLAVLTKIIASKSYIKKILPDRR